MWERSGEFAGIFSAVGLPPTLLSGAALRDTVLPPQCETSLLPNIAHGSFDEYREWLSLRITTMVGLQKRLAASFDSQPVQKKNLFRIGQDWDFVPGQPMI